MKFRYKPRIVPASPTASEPEQSCPQASPLSIERVIDHVMHAVEICGVAHVGVGSDYDGIQRCPEGLEDASCYGNLAGGLLERGLTTDEVASIMGGNMQRVFCAATGPGTLARSAELTPIR